MKYIAITALILVLLTINGVVGRMNQPTPQLTPVQMEIKEAAQWNAHLRWQILTWTFTAGASLALLGGGYYILAFAKNKRERVHADPETGLWPIIREDRAPFWKRMQGVHDWIVEDPNLAIAPNRRVYANGTLQIQADTHGVPLEQQMQYAMQSWPVQRAVASANGMTRPTVAAMKAAAGVYDAEARRKNAQAQLAEYRVPTDRRIEAAQTDQQAVLTPAQALQRSANGIAYIGQAATDGNAVAMWDSNAASTLGIFGANGTGKTTTVATMVTLAMLRWGWQLYILDGKDAGDWDEFGNHARIMQVDQRNIESAIESIWQEYQRRKVLMSQYRARNYRHLPLDVQQGNPQWGIVFEEYGATRLRLRSALRAQLDKFVDVLCKEARFTGWHGVFIDQRPSDYTDDMKGNLKAIACFKLLMNQGHAVNAYHAGKLANRGEFEMDGQRYWAFYAEDMCRAELAQTPPRKLLTMNGYESVPVPVPDNEDGYLPEPLPPFLGRNGNEIQERERKWEEFSAQWIVDNPDGGPSALARAMWDADGQIKPYTNYKSEAARRLNELKQGTALGQLQAQGIDLSEVRLRNGDKLGIDTTHGGAL